MYQELLTSEVNSSNQFSELVEKASRKRATTNHHSLSKGLPALARKLHYTVCFECTRHPNYPNIPAVTLHKETTCLNCEPELKSE